jgi:hypothetical protein
MPNASKAAGHSVCKSSTPPKRSIPGATAIQESNAPATRFSAQCAANKLGVRRFGAEEAVGWSVSRQMTDPGQGPPRSQPEPQAPLRPDAIDRTVRLTDRAPVRQAKPG